MQAIDALLTRVSAARLGAPSPTAAQREILFKAALRAPDHAQLRPWRFLIIEGEGLTKLGELYAAALLAKEPEATAAQIEKARAMPLRAPLIIVAIASLKEHPKVPYSEQRLTVGCAVHGMSLAAFAQGLGAMWRTGDMAHDVRVAEGLGLVANEEIIGYLYLGTPLAPFRTAPELDAERFIQNWG